MAKRKRAALYFRVSNGDQKPDSQMDGLREFAARKNLEIVGEYLDHGVSGSNTSRPQLDAMLKQVRAGKLDIVIVWKFDRFSRSLIHLITTLQEFNELGVDFVSITEGMDTTTAQGKLMFAVNAAFAQYWSDIHSERVRAGLQARKRRGKPIGRRPILMSKQSRARQLRKEKLSYAAIGKALGISKGTAHKYCTAK